MNHTPANDRIAFFDPRDELLIVERMLPHWAQNGVICFITWRTHDSIPSTVAQTLGAERDQWLRLHGVNVMSDNWRAQLRSLPNEQQWEYRRLQSEKWEASLDECHGECVLRRPELAKIVADSLVHFHGQRYRLTDFVVMPNHVHVLVAFPNADQMLAQCESWKHYTATQINRRLRRRGRFWQVDGFDHLVRSAEQFEYFREYIANNPKKANLRVGEFVVASFPISDN